MFITNLFFLKTDSLVFDDVEYTELAFRDAHDLVLYYRGQGRATQEPMRDNTNKRKKTDKQRSKDSDQLIIDIILTLMGHVVVIRLVRNKTVELIQRCPYPNVTCFTLI